MYWADSKTQKIRLTNQFLKSMIDTVPKVVSLKWVSGRDNKEWNLRGQKLESLIYKKLLIMASFLIYLRG